MHTGNATRCMHRQGYQMYTCRQGYWMHTHNQGYPMHTCRQGYWMQAHKEGYLMHARNQGYLMYAHKEGYPMYACKQGYRMHARRQGYQTMLPNACTQAQAGLLDACMQAMLPNVRTQARLPDVHTQAMLPDAYTRQGYLMYACKEGYPMQRRGRMGPSSMPKQGLQFGPHGGPGIPKTSWALGDAGCTHMLGDMTPGYIHGGTGLDASTTLDAPMHMRRSEGGTKVTTAVTSVNGAVKNESIRELAIPAPGTGGTGGVDDRSLMPETTT
ncbi:hypothetical protein FB451DRAFT_1184947 [Mycena latifolia]|nr:hypothetical protein FB451DRAFT_1184947 [Mycena latifolia]